MAGGNSDYQRLVEQREETRKRVEESQIELNRQREREAAAQLADRRNIALQFARSGASAFGVGESEGEQIANRVRGLKASSAATQVAGLFAGGETADNLRTQALAHRVELQSELLKGEQRLIEIGREEYNLLLAKNREYQRATLTAGQAEILRKLAVNQLGRNGITSGQFFSFGQDARREILDMPQNSAEIQRLRRERNALTNAGFGKRSLEQIQADYIQSSQARRNLYGESTPQFDIAARQVAGFGSATPAIAV